MGHTLSKRSHGELDRSRATTSQPQLRPGAGDGGVTGSAASEAEASVPESNPASAGVGAIWADTFAHAFAQASFTQASGFSSARRNFGAKVFPPSVERPTVKPSAASSPHAQSPSRVQVRQRTRTELTLVNTRSLVVAIESPSVGPPIATLFPSGESANPRSSGARVTGSKR